MTTYEAYVTGYNFLPELSAFLKNQTIKARIQTLLGEDDILPINNVQAVEEVLESGKGLEAYELARSLYNA